jgi:(1->4)-alpha-D-glucan 1-alpha-D-glucosylmutase
LSFVDPDNRRPVDFAARAAELTSLADPNWQSLTEHWADGGIKFALLHRLLAIRQQFAAAFTDGEYHPLTVEGRDRDEVLAFARISGGRAVIVAVGRLFARSTNKGRRWPSADAWQAAIRLEGFSSVRNALGVREAPTGSELPVSALFHPLPVAVLEAEYTGPRRKRKPPAGARRPVPAEA